MMTTVMSCAATRICEIAEKVTLDNPLDRPESIIKPLEMSFTPDPVKNGYYRYIIVVTQAALCTVYTGDGLPLTRMQVYN